jgi:hypothetical protein
VHLVGFIIRIYHDARSSGCQSTVLFSSEALKPPFRLVDSYQHCRITCYLHLHNRITREAKNCVRPKERGKLYSLKTGVLNLFCTIGPFESQVEPTDPFPEKCI